MNDRDREQQCASDQKAPLLFGKASEQMGKLGERRKKGQCQKKYCEELLHVLILVFS